jgi:hypothetical protein
VVAGKGKVEATARERGFRNLGQVWEGKLKRCEGFVLAAGFEGVSGKKYNNNKEMEYHLVDCFFFANLGWLGMVLCIAHACAPNVGL